MLFSDPLFDLAGTVRLDSASAVASSVVRLLAERFPSRELDLAFLKTAFADIGDAFWGKYPGYLPCDTPYHDLRHSLDTALLTARMVDGYQRQHAGTALALSGLEAELAVFLALYHDIGFLRRDDEGHLCGAQLVRVHEQRSVDFVRAYLLNSPLADFADSADLIHVTCFARDAADVMHGHPEQQKAIARMIGSADLISQVSDRCYLERCRDFLYQEFALAGVDRSVGDDGQVRKIYADGDDLLVKTPGFYEHMVKRRLFETFGDIQQVLLAHFDGWNPYAESMKVNLDYLRRLIAEDRLSGGLRRHPVPLLPEGENA